MSSAGAGTDRVASLEATVEGLDRTLAALEERVVALERAAVPGRPATPAAGEPEAEGESGPHAGRDLLANLGLAGRSLLVLAGAFLLRTVTELPRLPDAAGVAAGLAYSLLWLALAWRAAGAGARRRAVVHALTWALIAFPLVWEAQSRFAVLGAGGAALALAAATALGLALAVARGLRSAAWLATAGAVATAWALAASTARVAPSLLVLLALLAASMPVARRLGDRGLPWVAAAAVDLMAVLAAAKLLFGQGAEGPATVLPLLAGVVVVSLGGSHLRSRAPGWRPGPFDLAQGAAALAVGWGGALWIAVAPSATALAPVVGAVSLALAAAALAVAGRLLANRAERRPAFLFHAGVGFLLLLGGSGMLLEPAAAAAAWSVMAVIAAALAARHASVTLAFQASLLAWSAGVASGLLAAAGAALAAPAGRTWPALSATGVLVLVATAATLALPHPRERRSTWGPAAAVPRVALLALAALGTAGALLARGVPALAGVPGGAADAGLVATARTAALAACAVALAAVSRRGPLREAAVLVYPALFLGAVKLVVEDVPSGRPATLFASLTLYGSALILAPRLLPRPPAPAPAPGGPPQ